MSELKVVKDMEGNPLKLRMDLGAFKMVQKSTGKNPFKMGDDMGPDMMAALLYATAKRGGSKVTQDFIDSLTMTELAALQDDMTAMMDEFAPGEKKEKNAKGQS